MAATDARPEELGALLEPLRSQPGSSAILADIDGTLAPIAARPEAARVPEETREALRALAGRYALVGCASGRRAATARAMVDLEELLYIGNHGFELLPPGADAPVEAPAVRPHAERVAEFLAAHTDPDELRGAGLRGEDKGPIRAFHWRGCADPEAAEAAARRLAARAIEWGLVPHWGRMVVELRPPVAIDKGIAVGEALEERRLPRALYGGDDRTDLDAFRALREMRAAGDLEVAVCIGVLSAEGPPELGEQADTRVEGPAGFLAVLRLLTG